MGAGAAGVGGSGRSPRAALRRTGKARVVVQARHERLELGPGAALGEDGRGEHVLGVDDWRGRGGSRSAHLRRTTTTTPLPPPTTLTSFRLVRVRVLQPAVRIGDAQAVQGVDDGVVAADLKGGRGEALSMAAPPAAPRAHRYHHICLSLTCGYSVGGTVRWPCGAPERKGSRDGGLASAVLSAPSWRLVPHPRRARYHSGASPASIAPSYSRPWSAAHQQTPPSRVLSWQTNRDGTRTRVRTQRGRRWAGGARSSASTAGSAAVQSARRRPNCPRPRARAHRPRPPDTRMAIA